MISTTLQWLEDTSWAVAIRQSVWLYPALEIMHITGIVLLVGPAFMFDLCLLGFSKNLSVPELGHYLLSWSKRGLLLIIPSGLLLFITNAATLGFDRVFWLKMLLLAIAGINAIVFHRFGFVSVSDLNEKTGLSTGPKASAIISIITWLAIITCGRLLAY